MKSKQLLIVLVMFLVAITPSVSDAFQLEFTHRGAWRLVGVWYILLLAVLWHTWRAFE